MRLEKGVRAHFCAVQGGPEEMHHDPPGGSPSRSTDGQSWVKPRTCPFLSRTCPGGGPGAGRCSRSSLGRPTCQVVMKPVRLLPSTNPGFWVGVGKEGEGWVCPNLDEGALASKANGEERVGPGKLGEESRPRGGAKTWGWSQCGANT